jgi:hypothetical protein
MIPTRHAAAAIVAALACTGSWAQGLTGSTSTTAVYCCSAPTEASRISNFVNAVVGPGVEVPAGALVPSGSLGVIPVTMDFTGTSIRVTYTANSTAATGAFNGYLFQFAGAPAITAVTLDPASTFIPTGFGFTANSVFFNASGLSIASGATSILNVSTVPEASTVALMLAGLAAVGALVRRRRDA